MTDHTTDKEASERRRQWKRLMLGFHKACERFGLLCDGDRLLIGVSGGKDSLALVELLGAQARVLKPKISVEAAYVSVGAIGYCADINYLRTFCDGCGVLFHHVTTTFDPSTDYRKTPCFLCSWYRRKALFEKAKQLGCNKLALGHHKDDFVETTLLNLFFQGRFDGISPLMQMRKFPMQIVRPLCLIEESEIAHYAVLQGYRQQPKLCPYEHDSHRTDIKRLIKELEALNPDVRSSILSAAINTHN